MELEVLVTIEFEVADPRNSARIFDSLIEVLEDFEEGAVFDVDALLDLSTNSISLTAASQALSFREAEADARRVLEELFSRSLKDPSEGALVSITAETRPEKLLSSL